MLVLLNNNVFQLILFYTNIFNFSYLNRKLYIIY